MDILEVHACLMTSLPDRLPAPGGPGSRRTAVRRRHPRERMDAEPESRTRNSGRDARICASARCTGPACDPASPDRPARSHPSLPARTRVPPRPDVAALASRASHSAQCHRVSPPSQARRCEPERRRVRDHARDQLNRRVPRTRRRSPALGKTMERAEVYRWSLVEWSTSTRRRRRSARTSSGRFLASWATGCRCPGRRSRRRRASCVPTSAGPASPARPAASPRRSRRGRCCGSR